MQHGSQLQLPFLFNITVFLSNITHTLMESSGRASRLSHTRTIKSAPTLTATIRLQNAQQPTRIDDRLPS